MDAGHRNAIGLKRRRLIVHEGYERRHDNRQSVSHDRWYLIAKRLTGAGRHDGKNIPTFQQLVDYFFLSEAETVEAEGLFKNALCSLRVVHSVRIGSQVKNSTDAYIAIKILFNKTPLPFTVSVIPHSAGFGKFRF
ncbi:MAG: hypothetical protein MnENMB40S_08120 [Rhizobiaceae bacterium MnEN-MB40S]|nr:MAG: hypothetical protein MnENMB40S_08120 [Rhizobiaceae bacterium MnEN-MB40S]